MAHAGGWLRPGATFHHSNQLLLGREAIPGHRTIGGSGSEQDPARQPNHYIDVAIYIYILIYFSRKSNSGLRNDSETEDDSATKTG